LFEGLGLSISSFSVQLSQKSQKWLHDKGVEAMEPPLPPPPEPQEEPQQEPQNPETQGEEDVKWTLSVVAIVFVGTILLELLGIRLL
jgi:hypothetical protein